MSQELFRDVIGTAAGSKVYGLQTSWQFDLMLRNLQLDYTLEVNILLTLRFPEETFKV